MLKFHFVWQRRWIPQEEVNQLEQGASVSQIALHSPVLEPLILKRPFMTAAEGVTRRVWIRSSWPSVGRPARSAAFVLHVFALAVVTSFPVFEGADCDSGRNLPTGVT